MKRKQHDTFARSVMKLLCLFLALILIFLLGATALFQQVLGKIHYTQPAASFGTRLVSLLSELKTDGLGSDNGLIGGTGSGIVNILLIGQDRREGEDTARSDSMILCTFNKKTQQVIMTSFLRDLYVTIPGHGANRINAAYAAGGMELLDKTLEENFGLHIDGNVEVDFDRFAEIIDLLGGVELELRQDEADFINEETGSSLTAGWQRLAGEQALMYSRIRKLDADGDFSRTNRQRKVMSALLSAYRGSGAGTMVSLLKQVLPMLDTDLGNMKLLMLAAELAPMLGSAEIVSQHVPAPGTYTDQTIDGMAVLVPDKEAIQTMLEKTLLGE